MERSRPTQDPLLCLIGDPGLPPQRLAATVEAACRAGCRFFQLRDKTLTTRELLATARRLRAICTRYGNRFVVNGRVDIALAAGADGVHLPSQGISPGDAGRLLGAGALLGLSVHSADEIESCRRRFGDELITYFQFGPVFYTASKAAYGAPQGLSKLKEAATAAAGGPRLIAVGGINAENAGNVIAAGAAGVAVIGAVMHAANPGAATEALLAAIR